MAQRAKPEDCTDQSTTFDGVTPISDSDLTRDPTKPPTTSSSERISTEYVDAAHLGIELPSRDGSKRFAMFYLRDQGKGLLETVGPQILLFSRR